MAQMAQVQAQIRPLGDRVVVRASAREEVTKSGIVLPDTAKEKPQEGKVVAVGPGGYDKNGNKVEMTLKVGDRVLYPKYSGNEFKFEGEEYLVIDHNDILGLIEG